MIPKPLSSRGAAALELSQEYGFSLFPVHTPSPNGCSCSRGADCDRKGKHPRTTDGYKGASAHPEQITAWWDRWPDANIGLYPGAAGLIVVDVDGPAGVARAESLGLLDVATLCVATARGEHRYYRLPAGRIVGNVALPELDVRAHAGYVLAPPSLHASGHCYAWRGALDTIAPLPDGVLEALAAPRRGPELVTTPAARLPLARVPAPDVKQERRILAYVRKLGLGLGDGRKGAAFQLAAFLLHDIGLSLAATLAYVGRWDAYNAPPLGARAVDTLCTNAEKYGGRKGAA